MRIVSHNFILRHSVRITIKIGDSRVRFSCQRQSRPIFLCSVVPTQSRPPATWCGGLRPKINDTIFSHDLVKDHLSTSDAIDIKFKL